MAIVIGWKTYIEVCYLLGLTSKVLPRLKGDPRYHAFRTKYNSSSRQSIVGRGKIPIPIGKGRFLGINALVVDGEAPFIMGMNSLAQHGAIENHKDNWIKFSTKFGLIKMRTYISNRNDHARLSLDGDTAAANVADSLIKTTEKDSHSRELARKTHERTHIHPDTAEIFPIPLESGTTNRKMSCGKSSRTVMSVLSQENPSA